MDDLVTEDNRENRFMSQDIAIIKKYANRRLYNTQTSTYITLEDLYQMVKDGQDFEVVDAKTGDDITHATLIQIIFEGESNKEALMPVGFLRQLIRFYDDSLQHVLPDYLENSMDAFTANQDTFRTQAETIMENWNQIKQVTGLQEMENLQRKNYDMMRQTFRAFNPFFANMADQMEETELQKLRTEVEKLRAENALLRSGKV